MLSLLDVLEVELGISTRQVPFSIPCPFHNDEDPSLRVYPQSDDGYGSFYCWGCGKFGTAVDFVRFYRNLGWWDAIHYIREKYGVDVSERGHQKFKDYLLSDYLKSLLTTDTRFLTEPRFIKALEISILRYLKGDQSSLGKCIQVSVDRGAV